MSAASVVAALLIAGVAHAAEPLPALHAARDGITVSGVSSGGYMAVQFHVAHSARVAGAGVLAGGPYYCAQGSVFTALYNCMTPRFWAPLPSLALLESEADALASRGRIDDTHNLARSRVWLFSGSADRTVSPAVVQALRDFYAAYKAQTAYVGDKPAGHAMVTAHNGIACGTTAPPFIVDCHYDAAGELLGHVLGNVQPAAAKATGRLVAFDQEPYADGDAKAISMDATGYVYVPQRCASEHCRVHVAFHGCRQGAAQIGEEFVREAGYNRWADSNALIILYPQVVARYSAFVFNPRGCWDWWGYTGALYHTKAGAQIGAVDAMLDRLAQ